MGSTPNDRARGECNLYKIWPKHVPDLYVEYRLLKLTHFCKISFCREPYRARDGHQQQYECSKTHYSLRRALFPRTDCNYACACAFSFYMSMRKCRAQPRTRSQAPPPTHVRRRMRAEERRQGTRGVYIV